MGQEHKVFVCGEWWHADSVRISETDVQISAIDSKGACRAAVLSKNVAHPDIALFVYQEFAKPPELDSLWVANERNDALGHEKGDIVHVVGHSNLVNMYGIVKNGAAPKPYAFTCCNRSGISVYPSSWWMGTLPYMLKLESD